MIKRYGDSNIHQLHYPEFPGFYPRRTRYNDDLAWSQGLKAIEYIDTVDVLDWNDVKGALDRAHLMETMPMYHQNKTWAPDGFRYNQDGLGYCWTWSGTACMMDLRAAEDKETVKLSPVSMGYLVGWKNRGNYLESYIQGARKQGVAPVDWVDGDINSVNRDPDSYKQGWKEEREKYQLDEIWDTDTRSGAKTTIRHCATILALTARPIYIAYNWWGHALELVGIRWDESKQNNVVWIIRNSHNENDFIELDGSKGEPDEAYGFVSSVLAA
jgi:hypothetical protein